MTSLPTRLLLKCHLRSPNCSLLKLLLHTRRNHLTMPWELLLQHPIMQPICWRNSSQWVIFLSNISIMQMLFHCKQIARSWWAGLWYRHLSLLHLTCPVYSYTWPSLYLWLPRQVLTFFYHQAIFLTSSIIVALGTKHLLTDPQVMTHL